jgi:CO/xanthine dehydrogenase Mo-binding subunit
MVFGKAVRSPYPHALVKSVDLSPALACPGVLAVFTAAEIPGINLTGPRNEKDQPVLAPDHVRFAGEAVAVVAAESEDAAREGAQLVRVGYEPLPMVDDPEAALAKGSALVHEGGNLCHEFHIVRGDFEAALATADLVVTRTYRTQMADHSAIEPDSAVAERTGDGLTVWVSSKGVHLDQGEIARVLGLPLEKVRVIAATVGGSFGSKPDHPAVCMAALLAWKLGRPARVVLDREECFHVKTKRHPYVLTYTHAVRKDGKILGVRVRALADAGAYSSYTPTVATRGLIHAVGPYAVPAADLEVRAAYTNHPISGAFRGYGEPQFAFATERQMDVIARELGIDPFRLRIQNVLREGDRMPTGQAMTHVRMDKILESGRRRAEALDEEDRERIADGEGRLRRAWGIATSFYGLGRTGMPDKAVVVCRLEDKGLFRVLVGCPDIGQGSDTCMAQIAACELGVPTRLVRVTSADTLLTRDAGTTTATRVTYVVGNAVKKAAGTLRERLLSAAGAERFISDPEWLADFAASCRRRGIGLESEGWYKTPNTAEMDDQGQGEPYATYGFGAQWTRVCVDMQTWKADVERIVACYDAGHVINPAIVEGQVEGGAVMALGYGMTEEVMLREGAIVNPNFAGYLLPASTDAPEVTQIVLETHNPDGPFGAIGIGEITAVPGAASIANAVSAALGTEVLEIPVNAGRLHQLKFTIRKPD